MKRSRTIAGVTTLALAATTLFATGALAAPNDGGEAQPLTHEVSSEDSFSLEGIQPEDQNEDEAFLPGTDGSTEEATEPGFDEDLEATDDASDVDTENEDADEAAATQEVASASALASVCEIPKAKFTGKLPSGNTVRLDGKNRYLTAVEIAKRVNSKAAGKERALFLASGADFADGLALGALAANKGWPLLLTSKTSLPDPVSAFIKSVKPTHIYIGGGKGAVSGEVEAAVKTLAPDAQIHRFNGKDRYDTAAKIAECFPKGSDAFVATGRNFADAVVAAGPAAKNGGAIVLTNGTAATQAGAALKTLQPKQIYMIGGKWSTAETNKLSSSAGGAKTKNIFGKNRYATSAKVATSFYGKKPTTALFAVGTNFPDALAGASVSVIASAPVLLTKSKCRPKDIETVANGAGKKVLLGGSGVVSEASATKTCVPPPPKPKVTKGDQVASVARAQHGKAYAYGGTGPYAFDCSGLTQYSHSKVGISIPRSSYSQLLAGKRVANPRPGDVVVMGGGGHVGIYLSKGLVVDAGNPRVGVLVRPTPMPVTAYVRFT